MYVVRLSVRNQDATVRVVVADARNRESAGRLAMSYAEDQGMNPVRVDKITLNTSGFIMLDSTSPDPT